MGQSPEENEIPIEKLVPVNGLVLDPMVGGGTAAVACKKLKRRFIGIDKDPQAIEATRENLKEAKKMLAEQEQTQERSEELEKVREDAKEIHRILKGRDKLKSFRRPNPII